MYNKQTLYLYMLHSVNHLISTLYILYNAYTLSTVNYVNNVQCINSTICKLLTIYMVHNVQCVHCVHWTSCVSRASISVMRFGQSGKKTRYQIFTKSAKLGRFIYKVALRSHDQFQAYHRSSLRASPQPKTQNKI